MVIGSEKPLGVRAKVDEVDVQMVREGQEALVGSGAISGYLKGVVRQVSPQAQKEDQRPVFPVIIRLNPLTPQQAASLRLGMSALVKIVVKKAADALVLPILTLGRQQGQPAVRVMDNGKIVWRKVKTGVSDKDQVQITGGLQEGETIYY